MKQYCRYCCYLTVGDANYCSIRNKTMSDETAKSTNRCNDFAFNCIDAFGENEKGYTSRKKGKKKKAQCDGQMKIKF